MRELLEHFTLNPQTSMAAKKKPVTKATRSRSRARTNANTSPPAPTCPTCGRALQAGEQLTEQHPSCIRCEHERDFPGRDWDADAAAAEQRGIRLSSYVREQLDGTPAEDHPLRQFVGRGQAAQRAVDELTRRGG